MTCKHVGPELQDYIEDEITDPQLLQALESHFIECVSCRTQLSARKKLIALLKSAFDIRRGSSSVVAPHRQYDLS